MAKKVIWSKNAVADRLQILSYWHERTGSKTYSQKLDASFREIVQVISLYPQIGRDFPKEGVRFFVKDHYQLFYEEGPDAIHILYIWDSRRNPKDLPL